MPMVTLETQDGFTEANAETNWELQRLLERFMRELGLGRIGEGARLTVEV